MALPAVRPTISPAISPAADLIITKTRQGNFTQGQSGAVYTITASNSGTVPTSGTVTVTDTLPSGLAATAISGVGWSCVIATLTCMRNDALPAGSSYPEVTLIVNVAATAPSSVINIVTVSGGGEANTSNDTAGNPTTITAATAVILGTSQLPAARRRFEDGSPHEVAVCRHSTCCGDARSAGISAAATLWSSKRGTARGQAGNSTCAPRSTAATVPAPAVAAARHN